jgi:hypothetical protein
MDEDGQAAPPNLRAVVVLEEEDGTTLEVALPIVAIAFSSDQPTAWVVVRGNGEIETVTREDRLVRVEGI